MIASACSLNKKEITPATASRENPSRVVCVGRIVAVWRSVNNAWPDSIHGNVFQLKLFSHRLCLSRRAQPRRDTSRQSDHCLYRNRGTDIPNMTTSIGYAVQRTSARIHRAANLNLIENVPGVY